MSKLDEAAAKEYCSEEHVVCLICENSKICCGCAYEYHGCVTWKKKKKSEKK